MKKKAYAFFAVLLGLCGAAGYSLFTVSQGAEYVAAAGRQSIYELDVAKARGTIYDCDLVPLAGGGREQTAAVAPTIEAVGALEKATEGKYRLRLAAALENGKPFSMVLPQTVRHPCVDLFQVPVRYEKDQPAPHVVGYLDSLQHGASGIELAMNDVLEEHAGEITVYYQVDALGRVIAGGERRVVNTLESARSGVALTIDRELQELVQKAAQKLEKGAVVVTEVPGCEIRALASVPDFSPLDLGEAAGRKDSPLVNRAFCAYAPGSVFKLVTAAVELEEHSSPKSFRCTGSLNAGGMDFHCIGGVPHGTIDLKGAIGQSCNCYFISSARALGGQSVLSMAYNLGLGVEQEFGRGLFTAAGNLPEAETLQNARALANFAFGQGEVTATPLQLCGMMNAIASGGEYSTPKLIAGRVLSEGVLVPHQPITDQTVRVMKASTARVLQRDLQEASRTGTARSGAPEGWVSGAKTGTAQTGVYEAGEELLHFWYCGFVGDETGPRYCVTVLRESAAEDRGLTAAVFRETAAGLMERKEAAAGD